MIDKWYATNAWNEPRIAGLFGLFALWSVVWKGLALWRASKENSRNWFIALLILSTGGVLEIAYLFFFAKEKLSLGSKPKTKSKKRKKKTR